MQTVCEKFDQEWAKVDRGIASLKESGLIDAQRIVELESKLANLKESQYTIAVCGGVKAGKSMLINSLFFGDSVLPEFDSPMTAKITYVRALDPKVSTKPYAEISFYSRDEWNMYVGELSDKHREELSSRVNKATEYGVCESEWIGHAPIIVKGGVTKEALCEYVADMNRGGKYTPFVKAAFVYINHPVLTNLQVVDTPGLNDSNKINTIETEKWLADAHAVIYVFKHDGAHEPDIDFFKKYFPSSQESRVFVQNQIDLSAGRQEYESVKIDMLKNGEDMELKKLGLFGPNETICSYSALYALLEQKVKNKRKLTDDDKDWWDDRKKWFTNSDPDNLAATLGGKLYSKEGHVRVESAIQLLWHEFTRAEDVCAERADKAERQLKDCGLTLAACNEEIEKFKIAEAAIKNRQRKETDAFYTKLAGYVSKIKSAFSDAMVEFEKHLNANLVSCGGDRGDICAQIPGIVRVEKASCFKKVKSIAGESREILSVQLNELLEDLQSSFVEAGIYDKVYLPPLKLDSFRTIDELVQKLDFDGEINEKLHEKLPTIWGRIFCAKGNNEIRCLAVNEVMSVVKKNVDTACQSLTTEFHDAFTNSHELIFSGCCNYCSERKKELSGRYKLKDDVEKQMVACEKDLEDVKIFTERIAECKRRFEHEAGSAK